MPASALNPTPRLARERVTMMAQTHTPHESSLDVVSPQSLSSRTVASPSTMCKAQLLRELRSLNRRLLEDDPSLSSIAPWESASTHPSNLSWLEFSDCQEALKAVWTACLSSRHLSSVTLHALPEPDLRVALEILRRTAALRFLHIHPSPSQSLPLSVLSKFLQSQHSLLVLKVQVTLTIKTQQELTNFSSALSQVRSLQRLTLTLLPRRRLDDPLLALDELVLTCSRLSQLKSFRVSCGYEHNPYRTSLLQDSTCLQQLMALPSLKHVCLDNWGLHTVKDVAINNLQSLKLYRMPIQDWNLMKQAVETNMSLRKIRLSPNTISALKSPSLRQTERELQLIVKLNALGRPQLLQADPLPTEQFLATLTQAHECLDSIYWLIRTYPNMLPHDVNDDINSITESTEVSSFSSSFELLNETTEVEWLEWEEAPVSAQADLRDSTTTILTDHDFCYYDSDDSMPLHRQRMAATASSPGRCGVEPEPLALQRKSPERRGVARSRDPASALLRDLRID